MMDSFHICIIGLGYVGLPLAHAFSSKYKVTGFDISEDRIKELKNGYDKTLELSREQVEEAMLNGMQFTSKAEDISICNIYIVTVPTPIDNYKKPDLKPLVSASRTVGRVLKKNDIVIYESTVFPGCTEEVCVPILEETSGLAFNKDFFCGYSPERINPGDKQYTVTRIKKVTSGSTPEVAGIVDGLYSSIIEAGTHKTACIKVAEAAKVIENSQRDINIAFVNELALIFDRMGIDTNSVLEAAGTKWNFLKFKPGLVGGHCIGVDPYYLTYKAESIGYHPEVILAGRRINDNMGIFIANKMIKLMIKKGHKISGSKVLVCGITFKENCPDIRNSRVIDIINELKEFECDVHVTDSWADAEDVRHEYGIELTDSESINFSEYSGVIVAVAHSCWADLDKKLSSLSPETVIYDVKSILSRRDARL